MAVIRIEGGYGLGVPVVGQVSAGDGISVQPSGDQDMMFALIDCMICLEVVNRDCQLA